MPTTCSRAACNCARVILLCSFAAAAVSLSPASASERLLRREEEEEEEAAAASQRLLKTPLSRSLCDMSPTWPSNSLYATFQTSSRTSWNSCGPVAG
eukprot:scaffold1130_cov195-Pinguiococcus_pyrenoidosus.AAC.31